MMAFYYQFREGRILSSCIIAQTYAEPLTSLDVIPGSFKLPWTIFYNTDFLLMESNWIS